MLDAPSNSTLFHAFETEAFRVILLGNTPVNLRDGTRHSRVLFGVLTDGLATRIAFTCWDL